MKFVAFVLGDEERVGVIDGSSIIPLPWSMGDLVEIIHAGSSLDADIKQIVAAANEKVPLKSTKLLAPIRRFRRDVLCTGWNYWAHFEESRGKREGQDVDAPKHPAFFTKAPAVVIGPNDPIAYDAKISSKWDYEAELVIIFGRDGRSIPEEMAMDHVFGYCLANDISQRDLQRAHGGQWLKGKSIDGTMPLGPWVVTPDEIDGGNVMLECEVNGEIRQQASTRQMAFSIPKLIAELTWGMSVYAGDILLTGTPAGIGNAMTPPQFLTKGDEVIVRGESLGELRNRLVETDLHQAKQG